MRQPQDFWQLQSGGKHTLCRLSIRSTPVARTIQASIACACYATPSVKENLPQPSKDVANYAFS